jgi:hypothetical protein
MFIEKLAPHLIMFISSRMPEVIVVSLAWIRSIHELLGVAKTNVWNVERNTYDLDKADTLQQSIVQIEEVRQSLNKVLSNPLKYTHTVY